MPYTYIWERPIETSEPYQMFNYIICKEARYLFNTLGTTTPTITASVMSELVMGQYEIARNQKCDSWLYEARRMANLFFPINWVDSHLVSWKQGTELRIRRPTATATSASCSMAKDRRVTIEGQDLPTIRSDAADSAGLPDTHKLVAEKPETLRSSRDRSSSQTRHESPRPQQQRHRSPRPQEERHMSPRPQHRRYMSPRPQQERHRSRSPRPQERHHRSPRPQQKRYRSPRPQQETHRSRSPRPQHQRHRSPRPQQKRYGSPRPQQKRHRSPAPRWEQPQIRWSPIGLPVSRLTHGSPPREQAAVTSEEWKTTEGSKKPKIFSYQRCPARGCGMSTKFLKDHVYNKHLPILFHQMERRNRTYNNVHRQRLNGLHQLAISILGPGTTLQQLVEHLNSHLDNIIWSQTKIWGPLQGDMQALCRFAGWSIPREFQVFPQINSPAALLYWRILLYLLDQLPEAEWLEFVTSYGGIKESPTDIGQETQLLGETFRRPISLSDTPLPIESVLVEESTSEHRMVTTERQSHELKVTLEISQDRTMSRGLIPAEEQCLLAFDSHFHFDRTAKKLLDGEDISLVTVDRLLEHSLTVSPSHPVKLVGGVMVFCDPESRLSIPLMDGRWKVAIGVHPRKVSQ